MMAQKQQHRCRACLALVLVLALALLAGAADNDAAAPAAAVAERRLVVKSSDAVAGKRQQQQQQQDANTLIVALLDGSIAAVDRAAGRVLWTFDSGAPLVSARRTAPAGAGGLNVFPGAADGGLYAYRGTAGGGGVGDVSLERLPLSLPDLVSAAPSLTADGSLIVGRVESRVFALDRATGVPLATITADGVDDDVGRVGGFDAGPDGPGGGGVLFVGRQDYVVRSLRAATQAEAWNATYARLRLLPPGAARGGAAGMAGMRAFLAGGGGNDSPVLDSRGGGLGSGSGSSMDGAAEPEDRLFIGADNSLQAFDGATGFRRWAIEFSTPPISAFAADGDASVNLLAPHEPDQWPALPQGPARRPSGGRGSKIRGALTGGGSGSGSGGSSGGGGGSAVLIGAHRGSLYALPAARVMLDSPGSELALTAVPGAKCTDCSPQSSAGPFGGHMELLGPGGELEDGECRAEDLAVADDDPLPSPDGDADGAEGGLVPLHPDGGAAKEGLGGLTCPHLPLGLYELAEPGLARGSLPWLPASLQGSDEDASWMGWLADNAWQVLLTFLVIALAAAVARLGYLVNMRPAQLQSAALQLAAAGSASVGSTLMAAAAAATGGGSATPARAGKGRKGKSGKGRSAAGAAAPTTASQQTSAELLLQQQQQQPEHKQQQQQQDKPVEEEQQQQKQQQQGSSGEAGGLKEPPPQNAPPQQQDGKVSAPSEENGDGARSLSRSDNEARRLSSSDAGFLSSDSGARSYVDETGAVVIGRLRVGPSVLGYGSAGTIVYEGSLDARPVAVKRLLRQFYDLARKEIGVLIVSDEHPNVVRCFAMEEDREFVYLALERCRCALSDWILTPEGQAALAGGCSPPGPSPRAMALLSDVAAGLAALHGRGIVHRDLKPHNVLITDAGRAKLSDMGLSKQLVPEQSSFESGGAGGSSGWQAPEQLIARAGGAVRQTRAMDVFSLGCLMHYVLTAGGHPYGNAFERDANIMRGTPDLSSLSACREAVNLISAMLSKQPGARPTMAGVLQHPFWWGVEQRLNFLVDVSDRVEFEDREPDASLLNALEAVRSAAVGATNWGAALDAALVANLGRYRRYDYTSLRDLLRVVRNKRNHFREMPEPLQRAMGPVPDGYLRYFASRFPDLLMAVWAFAVTHLGNDEHLVKYWPDGVECLLPFCRRFQLSSARTHNKGSVLAHHPPQPRSSTPKRLSVSSSSKPPVPPSPPNVTAVAPARMVSPLSRTVGAPSIAPPPLNLPGAESPSNGVGSKQQQQQQQSYASALATTRAAEPQEPSAGGVRSPEAPPAVVVGYEVVGGEEPLHYPPFPRRPGQQPCEFYSKTGTCRFGQECCFDHPEEHAVPLTEMNLPYRDGEPVCAFYMKTHQCKFGASCKFHHPRLRPTLAGSASSGGN